MSRVVRGASRSTLPYLAHLSRSRVLGALTVCSESDPGGFAAGSSVVHDTEHVESSTVKIHCGAIVLHLFELGYVGPQISVALMLRRVTRRQRLHTAAHCMPRFPGRTRPTCPEFAVSLGGRFMGVVWQDISASKVTLLSGLSYDRHRWSWPADILSDVTFYFQNYERCTG